MPSAFRRAGAKAAAAPGRNTASDASAPPPSLLGQRGVKPWTGGIHLTSSGLNDLDVILGGGQPLGTCMLLREDRWTRDLALSLVKYWVAEAISHHQRLIIPVAKDSNEHDTSRTDGFLSVLDSRDASSLARRDEVKDMLSALPRNMHWDKQKQKGTQQSEQMSEAPPSLAIVDEDDEEDDEGDEGLQVAWQYKKSVQQERSGLSSSSDAALASLATTNVFCHSYDLSGRIYDQLNVDAKSYVVEIECRISETMSRHEQALALFRGWSKLINDAKKDGEAIRFLLFHPNLEISTVALPMLLAYIRHHNLPVVVLVCIPSTADAKSWFSLSRSSDVVMSTEGFASRKEYPPPPEFRHLQGLLTLSKVSTFTAATANGGGHFADLTTSKRPAAYIYGFKRDRRKLHITMLHIPPEDYAEGGGSVGSGVRSGAGKKSSDGGSTKRASSGGGMGCASNMAGSPLDF